MKTKQLHNWNLSTKEAIDLQKKLASKIQFRPLEKTPEIIAGLDCAFTKDNTKIIAAAVVVRLADFKIIETKYAVRKLNFPYIPGLLSFREAPACIAATKKIKKPPDLFIIDGQGIAHPRRLGLAAHLGLVFDTPTIGCAKSRLTGTFTEPKLERGNYSLLKDRIRPISNKTANLKKSNWETIGAVVRTRSNVKPVFISVGNKCTLNDAVKITLLYCRGYRLPEPTRLAHQTVSKLKTTILKKPRKTRD